MGLVWVAIIIALGIYSSSIVGGLSSTDENKARGVFILFLLWLLTFVGVLLFFINY